jgi:SAM-dependent methyltransferase
MSATPPLPGEEETAPDDLGLDRRAGDHHYRAYVGPPIVYDLVANLTTSLLLCLGLREQHDLLDLGCGSLRIGRMLIPYLGRGRYTGLEPNSWLIDDGIRENVGADLIALRQPTFVTNDDFDISSGGRSYDFVLAQSIFSHTETSLLRTALAQVALGLRERGALVATWVIGKSDTEGDGEEWVYPRVARHTWRTVEAALADARLFGAPLDWPHPFQKWFIASPSEDVVTTLAGVRRAFGDAPSLPTAIAVGRPDTPAG